MTEQRIAIVGVGETEFVRRSDRRVGELVVQACRAALADAGLRPSDVDGIVTEGSTMPSQVPADEVAYALGVTDRRFTAAGLVGGAGVVGAVALAELALRTGQATTVLSYYGADFGSSAGGPYAFPVGLEVKAGFEKPMGWYGQPLYFAAMAQRYRAEYGLTAQQQGAVAIAAREHATRTPGAMRREPLTMDGYLASPMIAEPFRALDCSLINDGAVGFVMTTVPRARDLRHRPVVLAGSGTGSVAATQESFFTQAPDHPRTPATVSGPRAFRSSGLRPSDVDIALIYDCFTISTIVQLEDLGFCSRGEGGAFVASGATGLSGSLPVNTHGGLLSHAYTVGASHVVEAVRQLRGERGAGQVAGAEVALVAGLGVPDHACLLLTGER
jgi:acetyl-CoA acetyltransferase